MTPTSKQTPPLIAVGSNALFMADFRRRKINRGFCEIVLALFAESAILFLSAGNEAPAQPNQKMKTNITVQEADTLTDIMARPKEFAEFMGVAVTDDILEMSAEELAADGEITVDQAETILLAASLSDQPSLWGAYQVLMAILETEQDLA